MGYLKDGFDETINNILLELDEITSENEVNIN